MNLMSKKLEEAFNLIEKYKKKGYVSGEKEENLLSLAEKKLGVSFPDSYRFFLRKYGCIMIDGEGFFGIIDDVFEQESFLDSIYMTLSLRKSVALSKNFVIISDLGDGSYYLLDCENDNKVFFWDGWGPTDDLKKLEVEAESFEAFLLNKLENIEFEDDENDSAPEKSPETEE